MAFNNLLLGTFGRRNRSCHGVLHSLITCHLVRVFTVDERLSICSYHILPLSNHTTLSCVCTIHVLAVKLHTFLLTLCLVQYIALSLPGTLECCISFILPTPLHPFLIFSQQTQSCLIFLSVFGILLLLRNLFPCRFSL